MTPAPPSDPPPPLSPADLAEAEKVFRQLAGLRAAGVRQFIGAFDSDGNMTLRAAGPRLDVAIIKIPSYNKSTQ